MNNLAIKQNRPFLLTKDHEQALIEHNQNEVALEDFVGREMLRPKNMVEVRRKTAGLGNDFTVEKTSAIGVPPLSLNCLATDRSALGSRGLRNGRNLPTSLVSGELNLVLPGSVSQSSRFIPPRSQGLAKSGCGTSRMPSRLEEMTHVEGQRSLRPREPENRTQEANSKRLGNPTGGASREDSMFHKEDEPHK